MSGALKGGIAVLDFGSQYTQLIARRLRGLGVYTQLHPFNVDIEKLKKDEVKGIILSGGPNSVNGEKSPQRDVKALAEIAPILGICYGLQLMAKEFGGEIEQAKEREYGFNQVNWSEELVPGIQNQKVWMSHGDVIKKLPDNLKMIAESQNGHPAALRGENLLALQFHPEVTHTERGDELLKYFAFEMCRIENNWTAPAIAKQLIDAVKKQVGDGSVLCALSGGVDSTVVGTLLTKALGPEKVHCVFVNNGLLRKDEFEEVLSMYKELGLNVNGIDAEEEFLSELEGISDPETKRKTIGRVFIEVFQKNVESLKGQVDFLAQGTLYPDVIESVSPRGESVTIKSHHNVGGLPDTLKLKLVEPLRELFKDEVRELGAELGLPRDVLWRHPFPGPGLAIRVLGEITREDLNTMKECDAIYIEELKKNNLYDKIWQAFCVLLPVKTVGVQGDARTYEKVLALRAVTSIDGMTADWFDFPTSFLRHVSNRITNEVSKVNRVVYDVTSKPPGTIEWE